VPRDFLYVNFDDDRLIAFTLEDFPTLMLIFGKLSPGVKTLFIDEIQNVGGRELDGLTAAMKVLGTGDGIVLTYHQEEEIVYNAFRISVIPAWRWLTGDVRGQDDSSLPWRDNEESRLRKEPDE
jgi:predicted AAA+ superfamily ATPase